MPDKLENKILDESELFQLGGKKSNFVILPAQIQYKHIKIDDFDKPKFNINILRLTTSISL